MLVSPIHTSFPFWFLLLLVLFVFDVCVSVCMIVLCHCTLCSRADFRGPHLYGILKATLNCHDTVS